MCSRLLRSTLLPKAFHSSCRRGMSTIYYDKVGAPNEVLKLSTGDSSSCPALGEVKVNVKASQVTSEDLRMINGVSLISKKSSGIAGTTGVGVVTEVGVGCFNLNKNDSVFIIGGDSGVWSDSVCVPENNVVKIPSSSDEFASISSFLSAWALLSIAKSGDVVVQTSGGSSPEISAVGKALNINVVTVNPADFSDEKKLSVYGKVNLLITPSSQKPIPGVIKSLAQGGKIVIYNDHTAPIPLSASASAVSIPVAQSIFSDVSIGGFDLTAWAANKDNKAKVELGVATVFNLLKGKLIA